MTLLDDYRQFLELTDHYIVVLRRLLFDASPDRILEVMTAECTDFGETGAFLLLFDVEGIRAAGFPHLSKLSNHQAATVTLFLDSIERWWSNRADVKHSFR